MYIIELSPAEAVGDTYITRTDGLWCWHHFDLLTWAELLYRNLETEFLFLKLAMIRLICLLCFWHLVLISCKLTPFCMTSGQQESSQVSFDSLDLLSCYLVCFYLLLCFILNWCSWHLLVNNGCHACCYVFCFITDESPHVHFPADQVCAHDAEIVVQPVGDNQLDIHLGFLQIHHHYQVQLVIKDKLSEDLKFDPLQNLNVSILEAVPTDDGKKLFSCILYDDYLGNIEVTNHQYPYASDVDFNLQIRVDLSRFQWKLKCNFFGYSSCSCECWQLHIESFLRTASGEKWLLLYHVYLV